jgi:hypothetical protein
MADPPVRVGEQHLARLQILSRMRMWSPTWIEDRRCCWDLCAIGFATHSVIADRSTFKITDLGRHGLPAGACCGEEITGSDREQP